MALLTKFLIWDLFVMYMLICITFLVSCCVWVSCMFLFYPAKGHPVRSRSATNINREGNVKSCSIRSTPNYPMSENPNKDPEYRSYRSKSINIIPLPQFSEHSTENEASEFPVFPIIESCPFRKDESTKSVKNK